MTCPLDILLRYQAWANEAFFGSLARLDPARHGNERQQALRLMNHAYVVARIFAAHLAGGVHGYTADTTRETPDLAALRALVAASDQWYIGYAGERTPAELSEKVAFTFTDGDQGYMSRAEMLSHVVLHGGYHRGEVGRILTQVSAEMPWDTFAVFLHQDQPERRLQGRPEAALS